MKQQAMNVSATGLLDASDAVKALVPDASVAQTHKARSSNEPTNPIYLLAAITLGIPLLSVILLVEVNPGIQQGTLLTIAKFLVFSAFLVGSVFEIKRLANEPSDQNEH
jgi:hypothetical protein